MKHILKLLLWLPALLWYWVIWGFSAQTAAVSGDLSDRLLWRLMALVSPAFAEADAVTQNAAVELLKMAVQDHAEFIAADTVTGAVFSVYGP